MLFFANRLSASPSRLLRQTLGLPSPKFRRSRGSALIETALLMPLMFLMLVGTMDFGRIFYTAMGVTSAARAGVQFASYTAGNAGNFDGIKQAAQSDAANQGLAAAAITITAKTFCQCVGDTSTTLTYNSCGVTSCSLYGQAGPPASYSEVTVAYTFTTLVNWPGIPSSTTITRVARMRVQ